jgi:succinyl-CoA synthetase alpha subunit
MSILINETTQFLIQGITGKQGTRACQSMIADNANVICGVTPGKGGQQVNNVPVYNSVVEAQEHHHINATVVIVPAKSAKKAIVEAISAGIPLINIITENIPLHDMAFCHAKAKEMGCIIIGPTSGGIFSVNKSKSGLLGTGKARIAFTQGNIGIISRSGGMSCETALVLTQAGLGQSTVVSIGSDVLMGDSFKELVQEFEDDQETRGIVLFGEIGGTAEEDLAEFLIKRKQQDKPYTKPIVAFISGLFAKGIKNVSLGHAGAIIEGNKGTREHKVAVLKEAGVIIADVHHDIGRLMKDALEKASVMVNNNNITTTKTRMKFKTAISKITNDGLIIRGHRQNELIENNFADTIFLLLRGKKPTPQEAILFNAMLNCIIDHGTGTTSAVTTRFVMSGGNPLNTAVSAGVAALGNYHGGAIENAMKQFYKIKQQKITLEQFVTDAVEQKKIVFGYGHKVYKKEDLRVTQLRKLCQKHNYTSSFIQIAQSIETTLEQKKGGKIILNVDGFIAAVLCEMGFSPEIGKGFFIIGRTPGLVAHAVEEKQNEKPVRRVNEKDIEYLSNLS